MDIGSRDWPLNKDISCSVVEIDWRTFKLFELFVVRSSLSYKRYQRDRPLKMELILELVSLMMVVAMASASPRLNINDDVLVVNVPRFDGELGECREQEVCADVFNFTRDHGDGTGRLESRFIQNCQCPAGTAPCGVTGAQLMFKETRTQSMATCEEATEFPVCGEGDIAKEQHNLGDYVYYKINCVCPNNEEPGDFRSKMTVRKNVHQMTPEQAMIAQKNPRTRYFQCRIFTSQRRRSLF